MRIRPAAAADVDAWWRMRCALWPAADPDELRGELAEFLANGAGRAALVAESPDGRPLGVLELSLRNVVDGCASSPVGYLEGWYVEPAARRQGIGRALVAAGEAWARQLGCIEMGSDVELANTGSQVAHQALGYEATGRVVTFRRSLL